MRRSLEQPRLTAVERVISVFSPRAAAARMQLRYYDAAGRGRRQQGWRRSGADANVTNRGAIKSLRDVGRDLRRNNGWARRAISTIGKNTIGWGIVPRTPDPEVNARWKAWAEKPRNCDADGLLNVYGMQRLVLDTIAESGEALVVRTYQQGDLRIRVLEPDYLDTLKQGDNIESGIERDASGRRLAYWLFESHPGSDRANATSKRVLAADVCHVFLVERAGQMRGASWLAPAAMKLKDYDDYEDAVLMRQKIAACFAAFVTDVDGQGSQIGAADSEDEEIDRLEPGMIEYLPPGKNISFADPPSMTDNDAFSANTLRAIAAALCVTYEDLTGDYSHANFSASRMARLSHWADVAHWRWNMLVPMLCDRVWEWFCYENFGTVYPVTWAAPPMPMVEPDREGLALQRLVRTGAMTPDEMVRERGNDPDTHWDDYAASLAKLDERKIVLDCDPRNVSAAGLTQERVGGSGSKSQGKNAGSSSGE